MTCTVTLPHEPAHPLTAVTAYVAVLLGVTERVIAEVALSRHVTVQGPVPATLAVSDVLAPATTGFGLAVTVTGGVTTPMLRTPLPAQLADTVTRSTTVPEQLARKRIVFVLAAERIVPFSIVQAYVPVPATVASASPFGLIVAGTLMVASGGVHTDTVAGRLSTVQAPLPARAK